MSKTKVRLLPCAFCGSTAKNVAHFVSCTSYIDCGAVIQKDTRDDAIKAWNTRVSSHAIEEMFEVKDD